MKMTAQQHFNGGFHDGVEDVKNRRPIREIGKGDSHERLTPLPQGHEYKAYRVGYALGVRYAQCGLPTDSSDEAWKECQ